MEVNMIAEGLKVMTLGMSTVFIFLILMVIILNVQAKIINRFFPAKPTTTTAKKSSPTPSKSDNAAVIAAITAAVAHYEDETNSN
jgi:oxaloacetate decarboxylase gamma subunit